MRAIEHDAMPTDQRTLPSETGEFTMRQVVALTGVGEHALRFYERAGLLAPIHRQTSSRHRRFTAMDVALIETIACLRTAGMSLAQMREYLALAPQGATAAPDALRILAEQRRALEAQARQLQQQLAHLEYKVAYWRAIEVNDEQALGTLEHQFAARLRATIDQHGK